MDIQKEVANALLKINAVGFNPMEPVIFKSGIKSPVYVDNRCLPYYPVEWKVVLEGFSNLIKTNKIEFDVLAGIAVGGIPHSSALGLLINKPSVFVRKEAKEHGKKKRVEGGEVNGKKILLVEDLVSTGGSSLSGVGALREEGAIVKDCLVIISYGFKESTEAFKEAQINLHCLTTFPMLLEEAFNQRKFSEKEGEIIKDWFSDPHGWAERQGF